MASPQAKRATKGGPAKGCPVSPPHPVLATHPPDLLGCPPPQPWQRRTPSSRALPPTPGKTLHQMVLTPGPPTSPPRAVPSLHTGGTAGSPPKGLFMAAPPPPPIHAPHKRRLGQGRGEPEQLRPRPTPINALRGASLCLVCVGGCGQGSPAAAPHPRYGHRRPKPFINGGCWEYGAPPVRSCGVGGGVSTIPQHWEGDQHPHPGTQGCQEGPPCTKVPRCILAP